MLGERIDARRRELGLSQKDLAEKSGLSPQYISNIIKNQRGNRIGRETARRLGKALRVGQIFFDSQSANAENRPLHSEDAVTVARGI